MRMSSYAGGRHSDLIYETANEYWTSAYFDVVDGYSSRRNKWNNLDLKSQLITVYHYRVRGSYAHPLRLQSISPVSIYIL